MPADRFVIGVDEAGKGDFFGPLVVAGLICKQTDEKRLHTYGVRDSKKISDNRILEIDEQMRTLFDHYVIEIAPADYNKRYEKIKNLNKFLAELHAEVITKLSSKQKNVRAVIDKFGKPELVEGALAGQNVDLELDQVEGGERHLPVAAASILARAGFVRAIRKMSDEIGMEIPKGAGSIVDEAGRKIVKKLGDKTLSNLCKIHFKNYNRVMAPSLFN